MRTSPREWVEAGAVVDGVEVPRLAVHLKGTTSFMPLDKRPSFTLGVDRGAAGRRLWGLRKVHLNNSVQDSSLLCEDLAGELFRRSGVPCGRAAWARVRLDDRDLGPLLRELSLEPRQHKRDRALGDEQGQAEEGRDRGGFPQGFEDDAAVHVCAPGAWSGS